jgi:DNA-binding CsgD family transcriptional regulator
VLQGASTIQIATNFTVSHHTVQQHLKSILDKTDVRSRRDLVGQGLLHPLRAAFS